jgi:glucosamine--fructose-6-phosphate aminotransferase (isomerizing)
VCGIAGYTGHREAYPILLHALQRVEYRGYDSCGIAIQASGKVTVLKELGFVEQLRRRGIPARGHQGIAHTRWATVGKPSLENAHPHLDCTGRLAIVHNGDIDNYTQLKERLVQQGHRFRSETDSEVLAHLFEGGDPNDLVSTVAGALKAVEGSYALVALDGESDTLVAARRESPLVVGLGRGENFLASDAPALLESTQKIVYLEDGDLVALSPREMRVWHGELPVTRRVHQVTWSPQDLDKAGYEHFFLKEVHEQPRVIRDTLAGRISSTEPAVTLELDLARHPRPERILLSGCGSAYHACLIGEAFLSTISACPVSAQVASELELVRPVQRGAWAVFLSQSGETADTIGAAIKARKAGYFTLAMTSSEGSSITRLVDETLYLRTGLEVSVAASKTFIAQVVDLYLLGLFLFPLPTTALHTLLTELRLLPSKVQRLLGAQAQVREIAKRIASSQNLFLIGKGINYPVTLEGALKLKEIAYLHAEGYPAGELKHGPFALLTAETPVIALIPRDGTYLRMLNSVKEIKARGAPIIALTDTEDTELSQLVDEVVHLPATDPSFSPILNTVVLQLLAYYVARERECPIDRPRNLAKSVTVH